MAKKNNFLLLTSAFIAATPMHVIASNFISIQDFQKISFSNAKSFENKKIDLSEKQKDIIENLSISVFDDNISYIVAKDKKNNTIGHIVIDKVYGKHEIIVYAVAINLDGTAKMIEILEYNESYGEGVLDKEWKDQFVGRTQNDNFKLNDGVIQNISGSTISCKHVSDGVKRTLAFYDTVINDKKK
jgi:Na+-translocating ferredoxin:NAD+ oxidoreductase RnfG subunit